MKNKSLLLLLILGMALSPACVTKKPSAVEQLKTRFKKDAVEQMELPHRALRRSEIEAKEEKTRMEKEIAKGGDITDDLKPLESLPDNLKVKTVVITAIEAALRKGPGEQFKPSGTAKKGDVFDLLRTASGPKEGEPWHLIQDKQGNRFFVSSAHSTVKLTDAPPQKLTKENLKRSTKGSLEKLQTVVNPTPPIPPELLKEKNITLNFEETEIYDVITTFCELLKIDYVIEGAVSGKVTLQTFNKIPVEDLYSVLEQILALHNFTVVKSGNFYRFLPVKDAVKKPLSIYYGTNAKVPPNDRLIIQIIPLKHLTSESMKKIITPLLTPNASFIEIPETNNLMMIELASNVNRIIKVVEALDIDKLASSDIELYTIKNTDASTLAAELREVFSTLGFNESLGTSLNFLPIGRLNALLIVNAFKSISGTIEFWINKLDQPVMKSQIGTFVYYVQNSEAEKLAAILNNIFKVKERDALRKTAQAQGQLGKQPSTAKIGTTGAAKTGVAPPPPPAATAAPAGAAPAGAGGAAAPAGVAGVGGATSVSVKGSLDDELKDELTIIPDKDTNSLIIRTSPRAYPAILEILKKLDLMPKQVFIEVLILDLTVDEQTQSGLEWAMEGKLENAPWGMGTNLGIGGSGPITSAAPTFASPGFSFSLGNVHKLKLMLRAFAADSKANVLSNPIVVASNNKSASISVTSDIPIVNTISTPSTGGPVQATSVEFKSVGIKLNIDPKINSENFVSLKVNQEISAPGPAFEGKTSFNIRSLNTEVVLKDNQVLVMGGLMQTTHSESNQGVSGLKDIPIFGKLFRTDNENLSKTQLMIFIVPHVINTTDDASIVTSQIKDRLLDLKKEFKLKDN